MGYTRYVVLLLAALWFLTYSLGLGAANSNNRLFVKNLTFMDSITWISWHSLQPSQIKNL